MLALGAAAALASSFLLLTRFSYGDRRSPVKLTLDLAGILVEGHFVFLACAFLLHRWPLACVRATVVCVAVFGIVIAAIDTMTFAHFGTSLTADLVKLAFTVPQGVEFSREARVFSLHVATHACLVGVASVASAQQRRTRASASLRKDALQEGILVIILHTTSRSMYSPIASAAKSSFESFFTPAHAAHVLANATIDCRAESAIAHEDLPNILVILNESMGNLLFSAPEGRSRSSYFTRVVERGGEYFSFRNVRAVSGMTETATLGIITGSAFASSPDSDSTRMYFSIPSIVDVAKSQGYATKLYCAYDTYYEGRWGHLNHVFDSFDNITSKTTLRVNAVNEYGMDDRDLTKHVLRDFQDDDHSGPWLRVVIWNNLHYPFLVDSSYSTSEGASKYEEDRRRYINSLGITDSMTEAVMSALEAAGLLSRTVVFFTADHGETAGDVFGRCTNPSTRVTHVPMWLRIPSKFMTPEKYGILVSNQHKLVSNLDIAPTIIELMQCSRSSGGNLSREWIFGQSLFAPISEARLVAGYQGRPFVFPCEYHAAFLSNASFSTVFQAWQSVEYHEYLRSDGVVQTVEVDSVERLRWISILQTEFPYISAQLEICGWTPAPTGRIVMILALLGIPIARHTTPAIVLLLVICHRLKQGRTARWKRRAT